MVQKTSSSKHRTKYVQLPLKTKALESIMALGYSKPEAKKWMSEIRIEQIKRTKKQIQAENASLRGKRGSAGR